MSSRLEGQIWLSLDDDNNLYVAAEDDETDCYVSFQSIIDETCVSISPEPAKKWASKLRQFADKLDSIT